MAMLLSLSLSNNLCVLGENNCNVPKILGIISEVVLHKTLSDDPQGLQRLLAIARHIQVAIIFTYCLYCLQYNYNYYRQLNCVYMYYINSGLFVTCILDTDDCVVFFISVGI